MVAAVRDGDTADRESNGGGLAGWPFWRTARLEPSRRRRYCALRTEALAMSVHCRCGRAGAGA